MTTFKVIALASLLASATAACSHREFHLAGTVTIASALQRRLSPNNEVMFIVAKNSGDVPVAAQRIVNPQFPVRFSMGPEDLIMPELPGDAPLRLEVEMNSHGSMGKPVRGDLKGAHPNSVYPGERRVHIVVDRQA